MKYYVKDQGMTAKDAYEFEALWSGPRFNAECAAENFYNRHGGGECEWPLTVTLVYDDGQEIDVTVDREYSPTFHAIGVKQ